MYYVKTFTGEQFNLESATGEAQEKANDWLDSVQQMNFGGTSRVEVKGISTDHHQYSNDEEWHIYVITLLIFDPSPRTKKEKE